MDLFFSSGFTTAWIIAAWLLTAIVHVGFAFAVLADSGLMERHLRRSPFLVGGVMWALATLLGGVFVAAVYWLVHHSSLRPPERTDARAPEPETPRNPSNR